MPTCESDTLEDLVSEYFHGTMYLFVPNICNAQCEFCYVNPVQAEQARIPGRVLERVRDILSEAKAAGFHDVKITGGEPLVFSNVLDLFEMVIAEGFALTILTNGILLSDHLEELMRIRPSHVVLSVHSIGASADHILGVQDARQDSALRALRVLAEDGDVRTTVVFVGLRPFDMGASRLPGLVAESTEVKVIRATDVGSNLQLSEAEFESRLDGFRALDRQGIRVTDTRSTECALTSRGFFSVLLPGGRATPCCVAVGASAELVEDASEPGALQSALRRAFGQRDSGLDSAPCGTQVGHCPLALRSLDTM